MDWLKVYITCDVARSKGGSFWAPLPLVRRHTLTTLKGAPHTIRVSTAMTRQRSAQM